MIQELADRIWAHQGFQADYVSVRRLVCAEAVGVQVGSQDETQWSGRLLESASVLALSKNPDHRRAARDIAVCVQATSTEMTVGSPARVILDRLSYFPTSDLTVSSEDRDDISQPLSLWLERGARRDINTVAGGGALTDFQKDVWDELDGSSSFFLTAPTSAGKSHVLQQFVLSRLKAEDGYRAVFLVPTRALISQVSSQFRARLREAGLSSRIHVHTVPVPPTDPEKSIVWVLTQERLHYLMGRHERLTINLLVVDEAQQIGGDTRGILLQTVVERAVVMNPEMLLLLSGPSVVKLLSAGDLFGLPERCSTLESPVAQNFIRIQREGGRKFSAQMFHLDKWIDVGRGQASISLGGSSSSDVETIARVVQAIEPDGGSLVYVGQPGRCDKVAGKLASAIGNTAEATQGPLADIAQFLEQHIHRSYSLAGTVRKGVAYHYREMPAIVRDAIEKAFSAGHLKYLVCTSTLLQGVNLPASNIFVFNPTKGSSQAVDPSELMNLVGRAGRLSHDLFGNVFLIEPDTWKTEFTTPDVQALDVEPALKKELTTRRDELLAHVKREGDWRDDDDATQTAFTRLVLDYRADRVAKTYEDLGVPLDTSISSALAEADIRLQALPDDLLERNITISPHRVAELHEWLATAVDRGLYETVRVRRPDVPGAAESIRTVFGLIGEHLRPSSRRLQGESWKYFSQLAHKWARGLPLEQILREDIAYQRIDESDQAAVARRIRAVLGDIEDIIRFEYVRLCQCYEDTLRHALTSHGMSDEAERMPSLTLFLEVGAVDPRMISLIGLGLSRTSAGLALPQIPAHLESEDQLLSALGRVRGLPALAQHEIDQMVGRGTS